MGNREKHIPHDAGYGSHARKRHAKGRRPHEVRASPPASGVFADPERERREALLTAAGMNHRDMDAIGRAEAELVYAALEGKRPIIRFDASTHCPGCRRALTVDMRKYAPSATDAFVGPRMRVKFKPHEPHDHLHAANKCKAKLLLEIY